MLSAMGRNSGGGIASVREFYGVQDFQDTATATTPLALTSGAWTDLPNDGLGPLSSQAWAVPGHGPLFNTSTGEFEFDDLKVGDMLHFRCDVEFITTKPNVTCGLRLLFGPSYVFALEFDFSSFKSAASGGFGQRVPYKSFQMKGTQTTENPAKFQAYTDDTGTTAIVNGWQLETTVI